MYYVLVLYALDYHMTGFSAHMTGFLDVYVEDVGVANDDNEQGGPSDADPLLGRFSSMRDFFPFVIPPHNSSEIKKKSEKKECQFDPKVIHNVHARICNMYIYMHVYTCTYNVHCTCIHVHLPIHCTGTYIHNVHVQSCNCIA